MLLSMALLFLQYVLFINEKKSSFKFTSQLRVHKIKSLICKKEPTNYDIYIVCL